MQYCYKIHLIGTHVRGFTCARHIVVVAVDGARLRTNRTNRSVHISCPTKRERARERAKEREDTLFDVSV